VRTYISKSFSVAVLLIAGLVFIGPVVVILMLSFNFEGQFPTLGQFYELLVTNNTALSYFWNSLGYALVITVACLVLSFPLGFVFAKVKFLGRDFIFFIYIIAMMLPFQATLLPNYIMLRDFGLLNRPIALILPLVFSPYAVFLFRQFIKSIPQELLEYATLETSSTFHILRLVVFPHVKTAAAALSVLIFSESWNMVEPVLIFTARNTDIHPLSVRLGALPTDVAFSAAAVYMYPILLLFMLFKETLASSMERFRWD